MSAGCRDDLKSVTDFTEIKDVDMEPSESVELIVGDIRDPDRVRNAVTGIKINIVVHLPDQTGVIPSLEDPGLDREINIQGMLNGLMAVKESGIEKFVFSSSGTPQGRAGGEGRIY